MYSSLLLRQGGGILPSRPRVNLYTDRAVVVIGIGGTGVAALADLKRKVYQQFIPDHPDEPVPRYDHIQFLAIDSDETDIDGMRGEARLDKSSEFFSIGNSHLRAALSAKDMIKNNPVFNWMEIDQIAPFLSTAGTGGIRQVGRYLLLTKAAALKAKIEEMCTTALNDLGSLALDIYIFAGLSGATGGGCFLDTCYIVRKALKDLGLEQSGQITGLFFLPDVVTSKPEVAAVNAYVEYNHSNGYAALKELDYLMDLKSGNDFFQQNYGAFSVNTQEPPVDLCYLISASNTSGTIPADAFNHSIHSAADYVMHSLYLPGPSDSVSFRRRISCMLRNTDTISHAHGAHFCYQALGGGKAEIPIVQIATYLSAGFYRRFQGRIGRSKYIITNTMVNEWVQKLGLTANQVYNELVRNCDDLFLPEIDRKELANYGVIPRGKAPQPWATPGNAWIDHCFGKRTQKRAALNASLETFDIDQVPTDSLIGRVFHKLYALSMDPNYGPYYAASLLHQDGYDLISAVDDAIRQTEEEQRRTESQLCGNGSDSCDERLVQCSACFCQKSSRKNYQRYMDTIQQWYLTRNRCNECDDLITTLHTLKNDLSQLYQSYFVPLITLLDRLEETFSDNLQALNDGKLSPSSCINFLMTPKGLRPQLDQAVEQLSVDELVNKFMDYLLKGCNQWLTGDDVQIGQYISGYMETVFDKQINRSLEDYLFDVFPQAGGNIDLLAQEIEHSIIQKIHRNACFMLWHDRLFSNPYAFPVAGELTVPVDSPALSIAADHFCVANHEYCLQKSFFKQSISVLLLVFGIPLYAYDGISTLKNAYDRIVDRIFGVGLHLYACTGRGEDGSGLKDWLTFLPDPVPYSCMSHPSQEAQALRDLYTQGEEAGILCRSLGDYVILRTAPLELPSYTLDDFMDDNIFQCALWEQIHGELVQRLADFHDPSTVVEKIELTDDGDCRLGQDVVAQVRMDHFLSAPNLQALVRCELDKLSSLKKGIDTLEAIRSEYEAYEAESSRFFDLIFYGILSCTSAGGHPFFFVSPFGTVAFHPISRITYVYTDLCGITREHVFSQDGAPDLPYSSTYPLYQAFLTYRSLSPLEHPRDVLDRSVTERQKMLLQPGDNLIARVLAEQWNPQTLSELAKRLSLLPINERRPLLRFYHHLVQAIDRFHDRFLCEEWNDLSAYPSTPNAQIGIWTLHNHDRYLYLYEYLGSHAAWDPAAGVWVPVAAGMELWDPIQLCWHTITDENGYLHVSGET